jgi:aldehyde:ferredoxin oxidoreductase
LDVTEGPYAGLKTECNQWEAFGTLQTRLAMREPTFMLKANAYCNQLGIDVDAAGGAIGWAMECYQRGILHEADTDGLRLDWGDADVVLELIRKICYREGFGDVLAEGCARAADLVGRDSGYYALHIKGQDLYEPCRGSNGWLLGTATSTRGGTHTTGALVIETVPDLNAEKAYMVYGATGLDKPLEYDGKAKMVTYMEAVSRMANCLGICLYSTTCLDVDQTDLLQMAELYSAATGWDTSAEDLRRHAMKQLNLEKAFNLRFTSFDRKDDMPTARDLAEPIPSGTLKGWRIDRERYDAMLDEYYDLHGWDRETSYPQRKTLIDLGLSNVADDLAKIGKLR